MEELKTLKTNQRLIVNLLERIINTGHQLISDGLLDQLVESFSEFNLRFDADSKAFRYLFGKYQFDVDAILDQRRNVYN